ncbi:MAG: DUF58 domain-containing protein, partial [bacterium]|nr:DUF58 domain-containing protein [bacterium]
VFGKLPQSIVEVFRRQRITRGGVVFILAILLVGMTAFLSGNNLLFLLLAAMLATLLISGFVSRLSLASLELDFKLPEHISARHQVVARIVMKNDKRWMPSFSIHLTGTPPSAFTSTLYFPVIPGGRRITETVEVSFGRRGRHRENSFQLTSRFPFGFTERRMQVPLGRDVLVYPCLDPMPGFEDLLASVSGELEARQRGRGHDFYRIRPYEPHESARHVDWKATAHTGDLQVREFAREQDPIVEVFLDLDVPPARNEWFEQAVDCCAFLVWRVALRDARVRFRTQDYDCCLPAEGDVYTILKYLALVSPRRGRSLLDPGNEDGYQVVFSARPREVAEAGWFDAVVLGPDGFPFAGQGASEAGAAENIHHGGGKRRR